MWAQLGLLGPLEIFLEANNTKCRQAPQSPSAAGAKRRSVRRSSMNPTRKLVAQALTRGVYICVFDHPEGKATFKCICMCMCT